MREITKEERKKIDLLCQSVAKFLENFLLKILDNYGRPLTEHEVIDISETIFVARICHMLELSEEIALLK